MAGALLLAAHHQATLFVHLSGRGGDSEGGGVWPSRFSLWHIVRPISLWTWRACVMCVGGYSGRCIMGIRSQQYQTAGRRDLEKGRLGDERHVTGGQGNRNGQRDAISRGVQTEGISNPLQIIIPSASQPVCHHHVCASLCLSQCVTITSVHPFSSASVSLSSRLCIPLPQPPPCLTPSCPPSTILPPALERASPPSSATPYSLGPS